MTGFAIMPWAAFVSAGALLGVLLERAHASDDRSSEARLNLGFAIGGTVLAAGSYAAASLPPLYSGSSFWTTSPSYFFLRLGVLASAIGLAYWWERRPPLSFCSSRG